MRRAFWLSVALAGCGDVLIGTETGNPNPRMGDNSDLMPTMPTMPTSGVMDTPPEPGVGAGGMPGDQVMLPEAGSAPIAVVGGAGPSIPTAGGNPGVLMPTAGQTTTGTTPNMPGVGFPMAGTSSTGSPSAACSLDQCAAAAEASVAPLTGPAPAPEAFATAECTSGVCTCRTAGGAAIALSSAGSCALFGRARTCLIESQDVAACDEAVPDGCEESCVRAEEALSADASQTHEVEVVSAGCEQNGCVSVVKIDGECYLGASTAPSACEEGGALLSTEVMDSGAP